MFGMAHEGYARSINPVHTSADGDSIYSVPIGDIEADQDLVGMLAAEVVSEAITRAVTNADNAYGHPAMCDLHPWRKHSSKRHWQTDSSLLAGLSGCCS